MGRVKTKRKKALNAFGHAFDRFSAPQGTWDTDYFRNTNPIVLELACGSGIHTVELALKFPDRNFIGIDILGERIWKGACIADEKNMQNIAFLRRRV